MKRDTIMGLFRESAGAAEPGASVGDELDAPFEDLGYDSVSVLEVVGRIQRDHGVDLPDDILDRVRTPGQLLGAVNALDVQKA